MKTRSRLRTALTIEFTCVPLHQKGTERVYMLRVYVYLPPQNSWV